MTTRHWCIVPAAGTGRRFGADVPKQYHDLLGEPMLRRTMRRLGSHPRIAGLVVVIAADDAMWPTIAPIPDVEVRTAIGGAERADSVLAGLAALPDDVDDGAFVLVHDAARPCVRHDDLTRLIDAGTQDAIGAILAAPVRDTMKSIENGRITATVPRENLWRALTPQLFKRGMLRDALVIAQRENRSGTKAPTDDANALEVQGLSPMIVEGCDDNLKVTSAADLAIAAAVLRAQGEP